MHGTACKHSVVSHMYIYTYMSINQTKYGK